MYVGRPNVQNQDYIAIYTIHKIQKQTMTLSASAWALPSGQAPWRIAQCEIDVVVRMNVTALPSRKICDIDSQILSDDFQKFSHQ